MISEQKQEFNKLLSIAQAQHRSRPRQSAARARCYTLSEEQARTNLGELPPPVKFQRKCRGHSTTCAGPIKPLQIEACLKSSPFKACKLESLELLVDTTEVDELVVVNTSVVGLFSINTKDQ